MAIACELSQRINLAFDECNDMIEQFEWYLLPAEMQRMLPFIMHFAQQPIHINCFGSTAYGRGLFKYVSSKITILVHDKLMSFKCSKLLKPIDFEKLVFIFS